MDDPLDNRPLSDLDKQQLWSSIQSGILARRKKVRSIRRVAWAGAVCLCLAIGVSLWIIRRPDPSGESMLVRQMPQHIPDLSADTSGKIQLMLSDGKIIQLEDESTVSYRDSLLEIRQHGMQAYHHLQTPQLSQLHMLYVPYGKRMEVGLPDGSTVWLNAGSTLTFPAVFAAERREVYITGEGYFDVKHRAGHPFIVHTQDLQINVLGTSFNVSAYEDDAYTATLLLDGSIALTSTKPDVFGEIRMKPGNRVTFHRETATISMKENDGEADISWRKKQLMFQRNSLPEILKKIERVYNASIDVAGDPESRTFSGSLDVSKPLRDVLAYLYNTDEYSITQQERRVAIRRK